MRTINIDGRNYAIAPSAFDTGITLQRTALVAFRCRDRQQPSLDGS